MLGGSISRFAAQESAFAAGDAAASGLAGIEHIVVLMMENRSFDNVLGWLYDAANAPPFDQVPAGQVFDGLSGKTLSNPVPGGGVAMPALETVLSYPNPDPGELFADVYASLFNTTDPPIPNRTDPPGMQGFVTNYAAIVADYNAKHSSNPIPTDPRIIMNGYAPATLPVVGALANGYAVCDHWFSSIPSQTFCNRSFVHAGTSSGYVNNSWKTGPEPWDVGIFSNATSTIYNLLEAAHVSWKIYYGGSLAFCNAFLTQQAITHYATNDPATNRFSPMPQFYADAAAPAGATGPGSLPSYSFIEPHFLSSSQYGPENDGHPPYNPIEIDGPSNLLRAELLIHDVYTALRNSPNWNSTLLVITSDEHGGCYDHVPPPLTVSPDGKVVPTSQPGGSGFEFTRLGVRVPTILVSPLIAQGAVINTTFDHTSIIKTVINRFGLQDGSGQPATLLAREAAASDVSEAITLPTPRTDTVPFQLPLALTLTAPPAFDPTIERPLSDFQSDLVAAAAALLERCGTALPYNWTDLTTTEAATQELDARIEALRAKNTCQPPPPVVEPTFTG